MADNAISASNRSLMQVELLAGMLPERVGSPLSVNSLAEDIEASPKTLKAWLELLCTNYYILGVPPYHRCLDRALKKASKYYLWDWSEVKDDGARFENMVASHLLKWCHYYQDLHGMDAQLYYVRDLEKRGVGNDSKDSRIGDHVGTYHEESLKGDNDMLLGNYGGFSPRRSNAPFLLAVLALLIFTVYGKAPAVATSTTLLTASGHTYKILAVNPLIFRTGKKCIVVKYVTNKKLGDTPGLREEAVELAREYVRGNPSLLKEYQEGILVQAVEKESSPMGINKAYNTPIGSAQVRKLLDELKIRSKKLCVTASGWSRSLQGPMEAISNARRGETYYFLIVLDGAKRDKEGREQLLITANFEAPVGKPQTLSQPLSIPRHAGLPVAHIFSRFDPGDPSGTYQVENIRVKDLVSGQEVRVNSASIFLK